MIAYNLLAVPLLTLPHRELSARSATVWLGAARRIALNPLILGVAGGVLLSITGLALPPVLDRPVEMVGRTALPLALVCLGAGLDVRRLRADVVPALLVSVCKLILYPGLVWLGLHRLGMSGADLQLPVILMASPVAVVSFIMAKEMRGDERLAGAIVIGSTLLSVVTTVAWLTVPFLIRIVHERPTGGWLKAHQTRRTRTRSVNVPHRVRLPRDSSRAPCLVGFFLILATPFREQSG